MKRYCLNFLPDQTGMTCFCFVQERDLAHARAIKLSKARRRRVGMVTPYQALPCIHKRYGYEIIGTVKKKTTIMEKSLGTLWYFPIQKCIRGTKHLG